MHPTRYFVIIDGHALIYRAYHAIPTLSTSQGMPVNAVYGFTRILLTVIRTFEPEYIAVAFDHPKPTKRHEAFVEYKAHREKMPDDMIPQ
ncbi:MAG TPA: ribonuclease HI, partial [Patescibacteria group bacterium]